MVEKLYYKMLEEIDRLKDELLKKEPYEILVGAEEYNIKRDIVLCMEDMDLDEDQAEALLKLNNPLEAVYMDFFDKETEYMNDIRETIWESAEAALRGDYE